jgi:diguanylate cyclase (GGDEF)-like protein/PAS domain S-box-containing protein
MLSSVHPQAAPPAVVLVIDDAPDIHELVAIRLRQGDERVEVLHAHDAASGLRLARERRPDVILLDLDLSGTSGFEISRVVLDDPRLRSTPIIFLTGTADVETKVRAFDAGATDYVIKPFDAVELRARVRAALRTTRFRLHLERAARQRETLLKLSGAVDTSWEERLRIVLKEDATTLEVQRLSYWRLIEGGEAIQCEALFQLDTGTYDSVGLVLRSSDYPRYFHALRRATPVVANDANSHPDTREFSDSYLTPAGIGAMMDIPVFVHGTLAGVVCHEHVGGIRAWAEDEVQFAVSIGHMLSLAIESEKRRHAEEALRMSEGRFRAIAQVSPVPLVVNSLTGRCLWGNSALGAISGLRETEMTGRNAPDFYVDPGDREQVLRELHEKGFIERREVRLRRANGEEYWAMLSGRPLVFDDQPAVIVGLIDLSEQKRMAEMLRHTALHDILTGLPNRALLFDVLRREIDRVARDVDYRFTVLYFDLDRFKPLNDVFGHDIGDRVLVSVAKRVTACIRPMDVAARVGGDEFAVVIEGIGDAAEVERVAARIEAAIVAPHRVADREYSVGASIGFIIADGEHREPSALLRAADQAMYKRKRERT